MIFQKNANPASFRDPDALVFHYEENVYRQLNKSYRRQYDHFIDSGLYETLQKQGLIIPHKEVDDPKFLSEDAYKVIISSKINFISYPYEWCFSQLKEAALLTLKIQKIAIHKGMSLKDASAYNVQFVKGQPIFIDTSSFEIYNEHKPWVAYRQFCQHFLAPITLMQFCDLRLGQVLRVFTEGMPLNMACSLLPLKARFSLSRYLHLFLHARGMILYADPLKNDGKICNFNKRSMLAMLDNLESLIQSTHARKQPTEWQAYYNICNYSSEAMEDKKRIIDHFLNTIKPSYIWDIGTNTGEYSRLASRKGIDTIAFDLDPMAVEYIYLQAKKTKDTYLLPLIIDITNPSPATGWAHEERQSLVGRGPAGSVMALALIHHLAIIHNIPLDKIASFFASILSDYLIIEFVPKEDSQVVSMLRNRKDIFDTYHQNAFEESFLRFFIIEQYEQVRDIQRTLYLMRKRAHLI